MRRNKKMIISALASVLLLWACEKENPQPAGSIETNQNWTEKATCPAPGWASVGGNCTGGASGTEVPVSTLAQLTSAISSNAAVIKITANITLTTRLEITGKSNMTIYGAPGVKLKNLSTSASASGIFKVNSCTNMIFRNLIFEGPGAYDTDGADNMWIQKSTHIWVDHCEFQDAVDGNLDITNQSDYITVTYCKFTYLKAPIPGGSGGSDDHRFSDLIGGSDSQTADAGKLRVTFARCWWAPGCRERMPRVRFGKIHILNCFYNCAGNNYCVGAGKSADIRVEATHFKGVKNPLSVITSGWVAYQSIDNIFTNCTGTQTGAGTAFTPPYTISTLAASAVESDVTGAAGATLSGNTCGF